MLILSAERFFAQISTDDVGDPTGLPGVPDQIDDPVDKFIADGAYDGAPTRDLLATRFRELVEVIIPRPKTAVSSPKWGSAAIGSRPPHR